MPTATRSTEVATPMDGEAAKDSSPAEMGAPKSDEEGLSCLELAIVGLLGGFPPLTMEIYIPSLPSLQESLRTSPALVLLTLSVYQACFSFLQIVLGPVSDVYGRRTIMLGGLIIYIVASMTAMLSTTIELLIAPRSLQAIGSASAAILSVAILRDRLSMGKREEVTAKLAVVRSSAPLLAPVLGSFLEVTCPLAPRACALTHQIDSTACPTPVHLAQSHTPGPLDPPLPHLTLSYPTPLQSIVCRPTHPNPSQPNATRPHAYPTKPRANPTQPHATQRHPTQPNQHPTPTRPPLPRLTPPSRLLQYPSSPLDPVPPYPRWRLDGDLASVR